MHGSIGGLISDIHHMLDDHVRNFGRESVKCKWVEDFAAVDRSLVAETVEEFRSGQIGSTESAAVKFTANADGIDDGRVDDEAEAIIRRPRTRTAIDPLNIVPATKSCILKLR